MASEPRMNWSDCLPAADAAVPCGTGRHTVHWAAGRLTLPSHPDAEAELVLGALGGDKPGCVTLTETWASHSDDLAVLAVGPRSAADRVSIDWEEAEALRANLPPGWAQGTAAPGTAGMSTVSQAVIRRRQGLGPGPARGVPSGPRQLPRTSGWAAFPGPGSAMAGGMEDMIRRQLALIELQDLLALGPGFQFRLAGTVAAAWAGPSRRDDRARRRPEICAALSGRLAPAAQEWLGIDPDAVTVAPHEGPGWGTLEVTGSGAGRRLRAALPVGWLADVWACGLAVTGGHLVVAVEEPGYPRARVLALPAPGAGPVVIAVQSAGDGPAGLPAWVLARDAGS